MTPFDLWLHLITDKIRDLAIERVLRGGNLATRDDLDQETVKLALLLIRQINDRERLTQEEEAVLLGVTRATLRKLKGDAIIPALVNW